LNIQELDEEEEEDILRQDKEKELIKL